MIINVSESESKIYDSKEKVLDELQTIDNNIQLLNEEYERLSNVKTSLDVLEKRVYYSLYIIGFLLFLFLIISGVTKYRIFIVLCIILVISLVIMVVLGFYQGIKKILTDKRIIKTDNKLSIELDRRNTIRELLKEYVISELCAQFGITQHQLEYDLKDIMTQHPDYEVDWWAIKDKKDIVCNELSRKYKLAQNEMAKSDLEVENLTLLNESIAIDNEQKKFWRCNFCGNVNRADDMSCINCGGIRPIKE